MSIGRFCEILELNEVIVNFFFFSYSILINKIVVVNFKRIRFFMECFLDRDFYRIVYCRKYI